MVERKKLFLDTAVFVRALTSRSKAAILLLDSGRPDLYSNEFCARELWHYLIDSAKLPVHQANAMVDGVRRRVRVLATSEPAKFRRLQLPKKLRSDKPVLQGAIDINAVLVTYDRRLLKEAKKFVEAKTPEEL